MSHALTNFRLPRLQSQFIAMSGGMDLTTPPIAKSNRDALIALNVQPSIGGGFNRIEGYECIDGAITPSRMNAYLLKTDPVVPDDADLSRYLEGIDIGMDRVYPIAVHNGELVVAYYGKMRVDRGEFRLNGERYRLTTPPYSPDRLSPEEYQQWQAKAFAIGCKLVNPVLGSAEYVLGVAELNGKIIAIRNPKSNNQDVEVALSAFSQGWEAAPSRYVSTLFVSQPDKLTNKKRVKTTADHTVFEVIFNTERTKATVITNNEMPSGANVLVENETVATVERSEKVRLRKNHPWQFVYHNFYGSPDTFYAYGCNGEQVIELRPDGTVIPLPLPLYRPRFITVHRNHLFIAFEGGQLGHSVVGEPLNWSGLLGAEQFGLGDEITGLTSTTGGVLLIGCRQKTAALYGEGRSDWVLKDLSAVGVKFGLLQGGFMPVAVSDHGIIRIDQSERFGNFEMSELDASRRLGYSFSQNELRWISTNPEANQLRFYSKNGYHLCIAVKPDGSTVNTYFLYPKPLKGVWQSPKHTFFAFDDGKVYRQSNTCASFAGESIDWHIKLSFNHCGSPMQIKSWHSAEVQATAKGILRFQYRFDLDYNAEHQAVNLSKPLKATGDGGRWNENGWNTFLWSAEDYSTPTFPLYGYSRNISLSFSGRSDSDPQFELSGLILNYITRRNFRA